ncbi:MAG: 16S rRNA (guanine(966)-N(2))-methyltransferase RsmD [Oscillospiraceae bacterium]|nr:16S rRNA (guanine(966)-N(2))-methyltransferase RsmD [Oscillospiraceae bacterium]
MRVVAGSAKGAQLKTLEGESTRPTADRVKEGMFSAVQFLLPGAEVLDLFAGSGQLGIEALSRGAAKAVFIDKSRAAADVVIQNLKTAGLFKQARVAAMEAEQYLRGTQETFDLVLLDPPYRQETVQRLLPLLEARLRENGVVLCETEKEARLPQQEGALVKKKSYVYGKIMVTKYQKEGGV